MQENNYRNRQSSFSGGAYSFSSVAATKKESVGHMLEY
jgi:hypothetical protein